MACQTFESMIALEAGGDLPAADAGRLARHLETCAACRTFAEEMRASQRAIALLADAQMAEGVLGEVRARVLREVRRPVRISASRGLRDFGRQLARWGRARPSSRRIESPGREVSGRAAPGRFRPPAAALAAALAVALGALFLLRSVGPAPGAPGSDEQAQGPEPPRLAETPTPAGAEPVTPPPVAAEPVTPPPAAAEPVTPPPAAADPAAPRPAPEPIAAPEPAPVMASVETAAPTLEPMAPSTIRAGEAAEVPPAAPAGAPAAEPMVIKLVSEEADLVIYWLVTPENAANKETNDEISAV